MPNAPSIRDRHNTYGVLITVLALVLAVVYEDKGYSEWDALVAGVSTIFAVSFLVRVGALDLMEAALAALLLGVSAATFASALLAGTEAGSFVDENLLTAALIVAALALLARQVRGRREQ